MTYLPTEEDLALLKSRSKRLYCRIELLNKDYQIIDTIEGLALSGSNSIDADSDTRRTFNLDIFPKSGFSISQFSTEEWTSKMLRLQIGMKAPTSMPLVGADAVRIPEEEIDRGDEMIGLLTAAPTHAPGVISFTIEQLWQMILSIAGGITAISAAIVVIIKAIKKAKEPDTKQNMKLIEHDKHLEDIDRKLKNDKEVLDLYRSKLLSMEFVLI